MALKKLLFAAVTVLQLYLTRSSSADQGLKRGSFPKDLVFGTVSSAYPLPDIVVALDGSGGYGTINEVLVVSTKMRRDSSKRFIIYVKRGIYKEYVNITPTMKNLILLGQGMDATIVTGSKSVATDNITTYWTATFVVDGDGFIAQDITFENTAGPQNGQAVALRSSSNLSVLYRCGFKGYQDTLYAHFGIQFYRECNIYGTIDFIFGDATVVFQNCNIHVRCPFGNENIVTAEGREGANQTTCFSFLNSRVMAAPDLKPYQNSIRTYLGRPWNHYSRTVFIKCILEDLIDPQGWLKWDDNISTLSTLYYGEYMNTGIGARTGGQVKWPGFHIMASTSETSKFTVNNFLNGSSWIPAIGVPFTPGL